MIVEQEQTGHLATVRLEHPLDGGLVTDLLFASSGIEHEIVESAERLRLVGALELPVATIGHLIALKLLARDDRQRPLDADDLRAISAVASEAEWDRAAAAVALIEQRGYHCERDLKAALRELGEHGPY
jgi:predicted nucleotidyltransferase